MEELVAQHFYPRASLSSIKPIVAAIPLSFASIATVRKLVAIVSLAVVEPSFMGFVTAIDYTVVIVFAGYTTFIVAFVFFGCKELLEGIRYRPKSV